MLSNEAAHFFFTDYYVIILYLAEAPIPGYCAQQFSFADLSFNLGSELPCTEHYSAVWPAQIAEHTTAIFRGPTERALSAE